MQNGLIPTYPAVLAYEAAFNVGPSASTVPPYWVDLSARTTGAWGTQRGRQYELDTNPAGTWRVPLENKDGALDPSNSASPYYPNVVPYRPCRIRARMGINMLTADQASAGQGTGLPAGLSGTALANLLGVSNTSGYTVSLAASGSAYTGSQVYQVTVPSGATTGACVLALSPIPVVPGQYYSATAEVVIPSGSSVSTRAVVTFYSTSGTLVGTATGTAQTITAGSSTWVALTASGQAPSSSSAAYYATLTVQVASGTLGAATTYQVGALQFEQSLTATPWQAPQAVPANMFPQAIATGTQSINPVSDSPSNWFFPMTGSVAQANFLTAVPSGQTTALAWTTPSGTTSSSPLYVGIVPSGASANGAVADITQVAAGAQYTASVYLSRAASADTTVQVQVAIRWLDATGAFISSSTGTATTVPTSGWVRASVTTAGAPAGAVWGRMRIQVSSPASTTATNVIYATGWQFEQAGAASTWMDPGPTQYIFTGYYERFPQAWLLNGTYGQVGAIGVDAEAVIAQDTLKSPFVEEVMAMNPGPNFFYQLADPAGASSVVDTAAKRPAAPIENGFSGPGSVTLGSSVTSNVSTGGVLGSSGTCALFANNPGATAGATYPETFVNLAKTTTTPGPPTTTAWTRMIAFNATSAPTSGQTYTLWSSVAATYFTGNNSQFFIDLTTGGHALAYMNSSATNSPGVLYSGSTNLCDGNWHQVIVTYGTSGNPYAVYIDGVQVATGTSGPAAVGMASDMLGAIGLLGANEFAQGMVGSLAHAIEFPYVLSATQVANLYQSWRNASAGESSGARVQRVLSWIGYAGATSIDAGSTANMGPASDLTGATGLDALNAIALTENGNLFVSTSGALTFTARSRRYNSTVPAFILGENVAGGEWPYESTGLDFDPQHLFNDIQVSHYATGQVAEAVDSTSQSSYLQRVLQRTINPGLFTEATDAANYLLQQYKSPQARISDVTLQPSAVPGLWAACMAMEIGTRIRVMRRPPAAPAISVDCFVESITWDIDPATGIVYVHLQCSPADLSAYWTLASLHTTLNAQAASGQNQATINALPDAAYNPLGASLSQNTGYQLVFDPGTSIQETMTLATGGVPSTIPSYATATLTFTSNFTFTHAAGATVCEVLPTGVTDPTAYDLSSILGATATTLSTAASSGTNIITVNALPDAKTNPAGADWTTGDLIWISPGTPNFEGLNLLHPNVSTAGEGALPLATGTAGSTVGVTAALGTPTVTASASAFQGANVWQSTIGASGTSGFRLWRVNVAAVPGQVYTASFYVRSLTSGANPQVAAQMVFQSASGGTLSTTTGTSSTLTGSATASWTRVTVTATAPAGAVWIQAGVPLTATGPGSSWTFQADGIQVEPNANVSAYQTCPQIASVGASVAGYSTVAITLAQNLANSHAAGDIVCDRLAAGDTSPAQAVGTCRVTY